MKERKKANVVYESASEPAADPRSSQPRLTEVRRPTVQVALDHSPVRSPRKFGLLVASCLAAITVLGVLLGMFDVGQNLPPAVVATAPHIESVRRAEVSPSVEPRREENSQRGEVQVRGYVTKNGTYVAPHTRSMPSRK